MPTRTRIKICGVTHPDDARAAANAGADAIGIVFHPPSRRYVSLHDARAILDALPAFVTPVGLFVDAEPDGILQTERELHLRHVQLHGHETPADVEALRGLVVIKAVRADPKHFASSLATWRAAIQQRGLFHLRGIVLETAGPADAPGGSGVVNDWSLIEERCAAGDFQHLPPIIAAGGLRPETVGDVVRRLRPWAVDVSSGVEPSPPGRKSVQLIQHFIEEVRKADASG